MKKVYSIVFIILFPFLLSAQELMTINQVFDFEINDEFHFETQGENITPNANRIKIIGKYYSSDGDTLHYIRFRDYYYTEINWGLEPPLEYHFHTKTDTLSLWNLESSISSYQLWIPYDTSMYVYDTIIETSNDLCGVFCNEFNLSTNDFEPEYISRTFGEGLGLLRNDYSYPSEYVDYEDVLFYYNKSGVECGLADTTAVSISDISISNDINIFPNPAHSFIRIVKNNNEDIKSIILTDLMGYSIRNYDHIGIKLDVSEIPTGIYFLNISYKNEQIVKKVFIE